jgi:hypothetical protein
MTTRRALIARPDREQHAVKTAGYPRQAASMLRRDINSRRIRADFAR